MPCLVILLIFVATVINMEARKVDLYEAVKQSPSRAIITRPQAMLRHHAQAVAWHGLGAKRAVDARATLLLGKGVVQGSVLMRLVHGQVSGPESGFTCSVDTNSLYFLLAK